MKKKMMILAGTVVILGTIFAGLYMTREKEDFQGDFISMNQRYEVIGITTLMWQVGAVSNDSSNTVIAAMCSSNDIESDSKVGKLVLKMISDNKDKKLKKSAIEIGKNIDCSVF